MYKNVAPGPGTCGRLTLKVMYTRRNFLIVELVSITGIL